MNRAVRRPRPAFAWSAPPIVALVAMAANGCGSERVAPATFDAGSDAGGSVEVGQAADAGAGSEPDLVLVGGDPSDQPLAGLTAAEHERFNAGDGIFDTVFRAPDGL